VTGGDPKALFEGERFFLMLKNHDGMPHGSVKKAKKADGQVTTLASGQAGPTGILLAGDTLYWQNVGSAESGFLERASDGGLMSVSKNGGSPRTLFTSGTFKVAVGGGAPQKLDNLLTVSAFIDGGSLFVDNGDRCGRFPIVDRALRGVHLSGGEQHQGPYRSAVGAERTSSVPVPVSQLPSRFLVIPYA
jgi:hypothetical protein